MVRALIKCAFARHAAHLVRCADWPNALYTGDCARDCTVHSPTVL